MFSLKRGFFFVYTINMNKKIINDINKLVTNQKYYVKFKNNTYKSFSNNYWEIIKDPDNKTRVRTSVLEKKNFLKNVEYIIKFINSYDKKNNKKIFDIGCGLGHLLSAVKKGKRKLYGCELDDFATNHAKKYGTIYCDKFENIKIKPSSIDLFVCHHVIEHVDNPLIFIKHINEALKKNGILILATPDFDSAMSRRYRLRYRMFHDKTHVNFFTNDSMHRFVRDNGFKILDVQYPFFETSYFNKRNLMKLFDKKKISPPFYGNFMTFFCSK